MTTRTAHRWIVPLIAVLACWPALAQDPVPFEDWFEDQDTRGAALAVEETRIEQLGLEGYYEELVSAAGNGMLCDPATEGERALVSSFAQALEGGLPTAELRRREPLDDDATHELADAIGGVDRFVGDLFRIDPPTTSPDYELFKGREYRISVPPRDTGAVAPCLWTRAHTLNLTITEEKAAIRDLNIAAVERAHDRWANFLKNVTHDQFPWETLINGWIYKGTLRTPPRKQLRLAHPQPVVLAPLEGEFVMTPSLVVQAIGIQHYSAEEYEPRLGAAAIFALKTDSDESHGWGAMLNYKKASFGVVVRDVGLEDDVVHAVFGVELAQLLQRKKNKLAAAREDWFGTLREKLEASVSAP